MSISPLHRSLFQLTARQSRLAREAQLHAPTAGASRRGKGKRRQKWQRERNSRRSGQALLLAVLLMVFAALLGSTFITVVSLNLNQTARQQNLGSAQVAATAGLTFVNDKLNNSALGEKWRPFMVALPPGSDDADYNFYYSAFDRAQGWTNSLTTNEMMPPDAQDSDNNGINYGTVKTGTTDVARREAQKEVWAYLNGVLATDPLKHLYVKFPDPRGAAVLTNSPQFLAELRPTADGTVRVDVIGQSSDDASVFVRETRAKPGASQTPLVSVARTVTNWDFTNNVVPSATINATATASATVDVRNVRGILPPAPFYVTISDLNTRLDSALVTTVTPTALGATLTVSQPATVQQGDFVQIAAALGTPAAVDYDADGTQSFGTDSAPLDQTTNTRTFNREAVAYTPDLRKSASILVNGGLAWMGNVLPTGLGTPSVAGAGNSFVRASGLITSRTQTALVAGVPGSSVAYARALNIGGSGAATNLLNSNNASFPFTAAVANKQNIVNDGRDRLLGNSDGPRDADSIKPPDISSGGSYSRYLNLTKYSPSAVVGQPSASLFGYGEGVYIDNADDKEKFSVTGMQWQPMDDARFKRMLFSSEFTPAGGAVNSDTAQSRLAKPYGVTQLTGTTQTSLEQKHLRGWIGPDEFRPRGVLIELDPAYFDMATGQRGRIFVTRDDLSDNVPNLTVPLTPNNKAWREPDGTKTALPYYRKALPWPANGVLYAEGNVRVKGGAFAANGAPLVGADPLAPDPGRSLTIVSGNNIYIEGSLNAGKRKVVLLAKNNAVVNPTAVLSRNKSEAYVVSATGGTVLTLGGNDASLFEIGDWVEINNSQPRRITNVDLVNNRVTVNTAFTTTTGQILRAVADPSFDSGAARIPYYGAATRLGVASDVLQRRFRLPIGATEVRFALQHSAQRKLAFGVKANNGTPARPNIDLTNKPMANPASSVILPAEKLLAVNYGAAAPVFPMAGTDTFPMTLPTSGADLNTNHSFRLAQTAPATAGLEFEIESAHGTPDFEYDATDTGPQNGYGPATGVTTPSGPLYFFLAALSNRYPLSRMMTAGMLPRSQSIDGAKVDIPMGTSIAFYSNASAAPSAITNDTFVTGTPETVGQLGFSPDFSAPEDALTIDDTFYTAGRGVTPPAANLRPDSIPLNNDNADFVLDARRIAINTTTSVDNHIALKVNNENVRFDSTPAGNTGQTVDSFFVNGQARIPYYRMSRMKIEGPANPFTGGNYTSLQPGSTIDIQAFVYAQEGSWLNIPGGYFDETIPDTAVADPLNNPLPNQVKTDAAGPYVDRGTPGTRNNVDTTVDGNDIKRVTATGVSVDRADKLLAYRFHRYNYQVVFTGAIMEKTTAVVANERNAAGSIVVAGLVQSWMDKWSAFNFNEASSDFDDAQRDALQTTLISQARYIEAPPAPGTPAKFANISYNFDPDLINPAVVATDSGLRLPVLPDLLPG